MHPNSATAVVKTNQADLTEMTNMVNDEAEVILLSSKSNMDWCNTSNVHLNSFSCDFLPAYCEYLFIGSEKKRIENEIYRNSTSISIYLIKYP